MPVSLSTDHPRPQLLRDGWWSLDGEWEFAFDREASFRGPEEVAFDRTIRVPFAPETPLSGIGDESFTRAVWYRRAFDALPLQAGERLMLRFGAVDHHATVWIDGCFAGVHEGGYTPFSVDVTDILRGNGPHEIVVRAEDDPHDLAKPRGKQDWRLHPHAIWYPRTTGIWQTVWLERLPGNRIETLRWSCNLERWEIGLEAEVGGPRRDDLRLEVRLSVGDGAARRLLAHDAYAVIDGEAHRRILLPDPGIDDFRNELLWSPASPTLIDAEVRLLDAAGVVEDEVASYTALRAVGTLGERFMLNGRPLTLRMVLDQGYWPDGGLTAPSVDALRRDVEMALAMGFNGVRKHQKIEDPRYLHWADRLGLLVWGELPSAYRFSRRSVERLSAEWTAAVLRDVSHPCIVAWVPFNESWGLPDLPASQAQRDCLMAMYHLTRALDPSRPVIGNDGWESAATDIFAIHDYDQVPATLAERYGDADRLPHLLARVRPIGRVLALDGHDHRGQPVMLTEFGGVAFARPELADESWGYSQAGNDHALADAYAALLETVRACPMLAGFCYTQFADTYQESNGLLYDDRTPKMPLERIAEATAGRKSDLQLALERQRDLARAQGAAAAPERSGDD